MTRCYCLVLLLLCAAPIAHAMQSTALSAKQSLRSDKHALVPQERQRVKPLKAQLSAISTSNGHSRLVKAEAPIVCNNPDIIGVKTTDKWKVMLMRKFVEESRVLKEKITFVEGSGYITTIDVPYAVFNELIPYLKLGVELTRIKKEIAAEKNIIVRTELEPNRDYAFRQLVQAIEKYDKKQWTDCIKAAIALRIDTVHDAAVAVGRKSGWIKESSKLTLPEASN